MRRQRTIILCGVLFASIFLGCQARRASISDSSIRGPDASEHVLDATADTVVRADTVDASALRYESPDEGWAGETHRGASTVGIYNCNDLEPISTSAPPTTSQPLVSVVLGLTNIEVLRARLTGGYDAVMLVGPSEPCTHTPLAVAVMDVNEDSREDIVVMDICRNWVALDDGSGGYSVERLDDFIPGVPSAIAATKARTQGGETVLVSSGFNWTRVDSPVSSLAAPSTFTMQVPGSIWIQVLVSRPVLILPGKNGDQDEVLEQAIAQFGAFPVTFGNSGHSAPAVKAISLEAVGAPYLRPFDGLDHLQLARIDGCLDMALAIGAFRPDVHGVPRQMQLISLLADGQYSIQELSTSFSVSTFGLTKTADGEILAGMIGSNTTGTVFALAKLLACGNWRMLGSWPTTFDWRTPDAPAFLDLGPRVTKTDGIRLLGLTEPDSDAGAVKRYSYVNYDGYVVHTWSTSSEAISTGTIIPDMEATRIHESRTDLAFAQ